MAKSKKKTRYIRQYNSRNAARRGNEYNFYFKINTEKRDELLH